MTVLPTTPGAAASPEEQLLHFLYLMPVGVVECDEEGHVLMVNPAAVRMLAPVLPPTGLTELHPVLEHLCPALLVDLAGPDRTLGMVGRTRRHVSRTNDEHDLHVELLAVRVRPGQVMVVVLDVTLERRLVERERAEMIDLNDTVVQGLVAAEIALGLGDLASARAHVSRSADAGRAWLGRQLELLGEGGTARALNLVRTERDEREERDEHPGGRG